MFSSSLPLLVCRMAHVLFVSFALFHIFTRFKCMSNMEGVLLEAGTAYLLWVPGFTPVFLVEFSFLCCVVHSWFVCLHPVFCVPNVASISGLPILDLFVFVLCIVCPMLPVSLDCPFLICLFSSCVLCVQSNENLYTLRTAEDVSSTVMPHENLPRTWSIFWKKRNRHHV